MNPKIGDLIRYNFYDDNDSNHHQPGLILEILNIQTFWSKSLGRYPDHVFQVLTITGDVEIWEFFNEPGTESELEIILRSKNS